MRKYAIPGVMLIAGHEIISLIALIVAVTMAVADLGGAIDKNGGF